MKTPKTEKARYEQAVLKTVVEENEKDGVHARNVSGTFGAFAEGDEHAAVAAGCTQIMNLQYPCAAVARHLVELKMETTGQVNREIMHAKWHAAKRCFFGERGRKFTIRERAALELSAAKCADAWAIVTFNARVSKRAKSQENLLLLQGGLNRKQLTTSACMPVQVLWHVCLRRAQNTWMSACSRLGCWGSTPKCSSARSRWGSRTTNTSSWRGRSSKRPRRGRS